MKIQIAKIVFSTSLTIMKKILDLAEFKFGKNSESYNYFKSQIMNYFYENLKELFKKLSDQKILTKCSCNTSIRNGYSDCPFCGGSGYKNIENLEN